MDRFTAYTEGVICLSYLQNPLASRIGSRHVSKDCSWWWKRISLL